MRRRKKIIIASSIVLGDSGLFLCDDSMQVGLNFSFLSIQEWGMGWSLTRNGFHRISTLKIPGLKKLHKIIRDGIVRDINTELL